MTEKQKLENKANKIIALYKVKYLEEIKKEYVTRDNDTQYLYLIIGNNKNYIRIKLDDYPEEMSAEEVADIIHETYGEKKNNFEPMKQFVKKISDFDSVKDHLFVRLLNTKRNEARLDGIITKPWHDLSMVLCLVIEIPNNKGYGVMQVQTDFLKIWGKSKDELFEFALKNADERYPAEPVSTTELMLASLYPFLPEEVRKEMKHDVLAGKEDFLCVCHNNDAESAAGFLYPSVIKTLRIGDYIIPSSTKECLIARCADMSVEEILSIVSEVNKIAVSEEEFLSNKVYEYVGEGKFVMH